jgi:hypothetical protein
MSHQCIQEGVIADIKKELAVMDTKHTAMMRDVSEIKWLVRIGAGGLFSLVTFLLKAKLGW